MAEPVEWRKLQPPIAIFFEGCGLPALWAHQPQWRILETGFGLGLNFLVAWHAWQNDAARPKMLHFLSTEAYPVSAADLLQAAQNHPELQPLAEQLAAQWWGLMPGFHRLVFEGGHVLLTLGIGEAKNLLREQSTNLAADSVFLGGFSPHFNPDIWDMPTLKAVARCARRGTRVATWTVARSVQDNLSQAGFVMYELSGIAPERDHLQGQYNPPWVVKKKPVPAFSATKPVVLTATHPWPAELPKTAIVIGAGLAGAAVAASLARRGWTVVVLESGPSAASGASSLPAGVLAPHVSRGDASALSELSRNGVRATLGQAQNLLIDGIDWRCTGVLQHVALEPAEPPLHATDFYRKGNRSCQADWTRLATPDEVASAGSSNSAQALWHPRAGWIKPASLVKAWLANANIRLLTASAVSQIKAKSTGWQAFNASGQCLAEGNLVVLAAGINCKTLALDAPTVHNRVPDLLLQPIRGQVSWGFLPADAVSALPPFPVNGHGSLIAGVPMSKATTIDSNNQALPLAWMAGASYTRDSCDLEISSADHAHNLARLQTLAPPAAKTLAPWFENAPSYGPSHALHSWTGVRCASPNRLPLVGPLVQPAEEGMPPQWWICTAMGSRGLTLAALCGELLAARLHGEPLATGRKLANALSY